MAYNISLTNGQNLVTIADGTTDTSFTSLTLIGKNFAGYGQFLNENYVKMLENFSNNTAPPNPIQGQLFWNSTTKVLKVYTGTVWKTVSGSTTSATAPAIPITGDLWWDVNNGQLKVWGESQWVVIGPAYTAAQGRTGLFADSVFQTGGALSHIIVKFVVNDTIVAVLSKDASFTTTDIPGFTTINPGFNLATVSSNALGYYGDANNALNLGGVAAANFMRKDQSSTTAFPISITSDSGLTVGAASDFKVVASNTSVDLRGQSIGKDLNMWVNIAGIATKSVSINATNGSVVLAADPTVALGAATKQYVDNQIGGTTSVGLLRNGGNTITGSILPGSNDLYNLGSAAATFNRIYATNFMGTASNSLSLGGIVASSYVRNDAASPMSVPLTVTHNNGITIGNAGDFTIDVTSAPNAVNLRSRTSSKALTLSVNIAGTPTTVATFSGSTGLCTVAGDPVDPKGIATRQYVLAQLNGGTGITLASITGSMLPNVNNSYNIGSSAMKWNTMYATSFNGNSTSANYADLAERFESDASYKPGTVVELGGAKEITAAMDDLSDNVFGVISTKAAYLMNAGAGDDETHPPIAMQGRVPVRVIGTVSKGDRLVSAGNGLARAASKAEVTSFNVIGRALANKTTAGEGTVEAIVRLNS